MAQLNEYLEYFDKDKILIITAERLQQNRQETLRQIFRFVGADENYSSDSFDQIRHDSSVKVKRNFFGRALARYPVLRNAESFAKSIIPYRWYPMFARMLGSSFDKPLLSPEMKKKIEKLLHNEIQELKQFTGRDFEEWQ